MMNNTKNPSQYLLDYLSDFEVLIAKHAAMSYARKYYIFRDGFMYSGTDNFTDVLKLVDNDLGLHTYKVNKWNS